MSKEPLGPTMLKRIAELKAEVEKLRAEVERLTKAEDGKLIEVTYIKGIAGVGKKGGQP